MESDVLPEIPRKKTNRNWLLFLILIAGTTFRFYGIRWGMPSFFHPDERQIMFKVNDISWNDLNPHFFAYGSLPIYVLKGTVTGLDRVNRFVVDAARKMELDAKKVSRVREWFPPMNHFRGQTLTGRALSAIVSIWTIVVLFYLGRLMYQKKIALIAAALFSFSVLSIQQSHFYVVDGPQTFLVVCAIYFMVRMAVGDRARDYYYSGLFIGLAMSTKFSSLPIYIAYAFAHFLALVHGNRKGFTHWLHLIGGALLSVAVMTAGMPYWILDHEKWWRDIQEQSRMVRGTARLPYTIQYENTAPFWYLIKNMAIWSLGLPFGMAAFAGFAVAIRRFFVQTKDLGNQVLLAYVVPIFIVNSLFQVKFLRYTLPLLPFFALFAAKMLFDLQKRHRMRTPAKILTIVVLTGTLIWAIAYTTVYRYPNTRIEASSWVYQNIPSGAHILLESNWDDALPVGTPDGNPSVYTTKKLEIYREPENERKAGEMAEMLEWGDVIILPSKRHYGSVLRIPERFPVSGNFYRSLFAERLGYRYVRCFTSPPRLGRLKFEDDLADESFRVYDHPKVAIFQKETALTRDQILPYLLNPPPEIAEITYEDILRAVPPDAVGSRISFPVIRWLIILEILGIMVFPTAFLIFHRFNHRGYPLNKTIGLITAGYICWLIPSLKWVPFTRTFLFLVIVLFLAANCMLYMRHRQAIHHFVKQYWWSIAGYELLFAAVFGLFVFLKSYNPDIFWSESSMDFGFVNSILRSDYFPPHDPWIEGEPINYYYYGHYLAAFMTRLAGIESSYGYNLFFATIPALVALAVASILISLTRRLWAGVLGVLFTIVIGNLDGVAQMAQIWSRIPKTSGLFPAAGIFRDFVGSFLVLGRSEVHFRFFRSAHELIRPTVHEFPYWSYNFMDLHAHTIATLISSLVLVFHLVLFRNRKKGFGIFGTGITRYLTLGVLSIALGALIPTNSWDFPTHCLVIFLILNFMPLEKPAGSKRTAEPGGVKAYSAPEPLFIPDSEPISFPEDIPDETGTTKPSETESGFKTGEYLAGIADRSARFIVDLLLTVQHNLMAMIVPLLTLIGISLFLYLPYLSHFSRKGMGIGFVHQYRQTTNFDGYFTMFGFFLFIFATLLVRWWYLVQRRKGRGVLSIGLTFMIVVLGSVLLFNILKATFLIDYSVLIFNTVIMVVVLYLFSRSRSDADQKFVLLFAFMALAITAGCEIIYIKDFYQGGDHRRFNTIFKFYMQAWFFFAIVSAYLVTDRFKIRKPDPLFRGWKSISTLGKWAWNLIFILLLSGALIFTFQGPRARKTHDEYRRVELPLTLDGLAYMKKGGWDQEYRAIHWINKHIRGAPVILEASGPDYEYQYGRISANTGLPTVLGWWSHVDQREYGRNTGRMKLDVVEMYEGIDIPRLLALLLKYHVKYIYVGSTEKNKYTNIGLDKFSRLTDYMTPVYANPEVTIFRINDYGLNVDFASVARDSNALSDLQQRVLEEQEKKLEQEKREEEARREALKSAAPTSMFVGGEGEIRGQFREPRSLAVGPDGMIYVADFRNHRIQKFNPQGDWLNAWGSSGDETGQFKDICGVAVDADGVYVADTFNNRIQKFSHDGEFISQWRGDQTSFFYPRGIGADQKGFIYLADTGNNRIIKMSNEGKQIAIWGKLGRGEGEFESPIGIHASGDKIYIADTRNRRIQVLDSSGAFILSWPIDGWEGEVFVEPYIAVDINQNVWVSDPTANRILIFDPTGKKLASISRDHRGRPFARPMGLALDSEGGILVVDTHHHRLTQTPPLK
ncbi:glycosyltransferase family 39 protein [bacterium]|nr:glycosyltransferase family 39 protein [candidate division CSSED10-310 bacterium]